MRNVKQDISCKTQSQQFVLSGHRTTVNVTRRDKHCFGLFFLEGGGGFGKK